ncbi:hypothetical protein DPQ25_00325 [Hydrogeniiclostridium mannosilyticum]|uniref:Uncharacterized protein n=1 Tax=Hydrogeniiclostridium mannosilyticum TaxID=2764322 RepID=A0A328UG20_9FIRM|nr:hypothetical protein DPQ25_00325 [Hydrogeniiclostridium mannosilyticum]
MRWKILSISRIWKRAPWCTAALSAIWGNTRVRPTRSALSWGPAAVGTVRRARRKRESPAVSGKAFPSLEAYGVFVSKLAQACGMRYINGANTVTYFGVVLYDPA